MYKSGLAGLFAGGNAGNENSPKNSNEDNNSFIIGRVTDVCLNTDSSMFVEGNWSSIGTISFQILGASSPPLVGNQTPSTSALPLFNQLKNYPLVNEFVILFPGAGQDNPQTSNKKQYYYIPLNIWNTPHYNGYPSPFNENASSQDTSYEQVEAGNPQTQDNNPETINVNGTSGGNFIEKGDISPILPFAGDQIIEGRNGNSIRFGSTATTSGEIRNNWSDGSDEGDPITILKNGQPVSSSLDGYKPTTENINTDPSSLYLTSKQQIPISVSVGFNASSNGEKDTVPFSSVIKNTPISPKSYNSSQIILNSGRLLFNTTGDSMLFSSKKSIVLESQEDLGIKSLTRNVNILAPQGNVSIGQKNASDAAILGTSFINLITPFLGLLKTTLEQLKNEPQLSVSKPSSMATATELQSVLNKIQTTLSDKVKLS